MLLNFKIKKTSTMRFRNKFIFFSSKYDFISRFLINKKSSSGRNVTGRLCVLSKKHRKRQKFPLLNFFRHNRLDCFFVKYIINNTMTRKKYFVCSDFENDLFLLPAVQGVTIGTEFIIDNKFFINNTTVDLGLPCLLKLVMFYRQISNIFSLNTNKNSYSNSSGCYSTKIPNKKKEKLLKIVLPSKTIKFFKPYTTCLIGRNALSDKKLFKPGKAGITFNYGIKSSVRGVAKNPVDHPNGGRTKSCKPEMSPWGWIAKLNK